jgi:hypothetical protein
MPAHPFISIPLDIPDVRVFQIAIAKQRECILPSRCERTWNSWPRTIANWSS